MIIDFLGDSITEGVGASSLNKCYVSKVAEFLNAAVYNCGISGTRIARRKNFYKHIFEVDFVKRVDLLPMPADYVFVFGGTNDYGHGDAPIGKVSDNDVWTFCGATNCLIDELEKIIEKDKIVFITPCKRFGWREKAPFTDGNLKDFVDALISVLERRGIKHIDLWQAFDEPENEGNTEFFADGLHPNDNGHEKIARIISDFVKVDSGISVENK